MNLFKNWKVNFINWTWELPQTLLGWVMMKSVIVYKVEDFKGVKLVLMAKKSFGISLGRYILLSKYTREISKNHEFGHCRQSKMLGPFYLLVVGLPSITMNIMSQLKIVHRLFPEFEGDYYNRFPENWADRLGGVKRNVIYKIKY